MGTSKLQQQIGRTLHQIFKGCTIAENTRPDWLITPDGERCELDFYIEDLGLAIEVQGKQHYVHIPHFHPSYNDFLRQKQRDDFKRIACRKRGINLYEISSESEAEHFVANLVLNSHLIEEEPEEELIESRKKNIVFDRQPNMSEALGRGTNSKNWKRINVRMSNRILNLLDFSSVPHVDLAQLFQVIAYSIQRPREKHCYRFLMTYAGWIRLYLKHQKDMDEETLCR